MNAEILLSIIGTFLVLALGVNGFFLRGIFKDLNDVKIQLAHVIEGGKNKERRIDNLETNEREIFDRLNKLEREI